MNSSPGKFAPTRWTLVIEAAGSDSAARRALGELCEMYYEPVVVFLRRHLRDPDAARDVAHEFFAKVLEGRALGGVDRERGRFRSYLLGALKHFVMDRADRARAARRGGGAILETLEFEEVATPPADDLTFDRQWALTLIATALARIEAEWVAAGKAAQFAVLKRWLIGGEVMPQADAARELNIAEGTVKVAIHRLRQRFREVIRAEIEQTVPDRRDVDDELGHLLAVLVAG
jgi:RNA polymerase sigma factor (sigma-70 family)